MKYFTPKSSDAQNIIFANEERQYSFQRLPSKYKNKIRKEVWSLSENNAGINIHLSTNSKILKLEWSVKLDFKMNHMTDTGVKGLDIYECIDNKWCYNSTGLPIGSNNEHLIKFKNTKRKILCIYLPLYDTVTKLNIGIDDSSNLTFLKNKNKPIVFYGTSITQGGCASRPGMAHTNILSRKTNDPIINLGFSGNGHLEESIGRILREINARCFVIDCLPNVNTSQIKSNVIPLVKSIRNIEKGYQCPIIFLEQPIIHDQYIDEDVVYKNRILLQQIKECDKLGLRDIHLIDQNGSLGSDNETTVDGIHYNDIGFLRYANHIYKSLKKII
tara:strand:- start:1604 stop:2593 length:990 start_codon:yes stop_codon:yes gene_type:complete